MSVLEDKILEQQETIKGMQNNEESLLKIMKEYEDYKLRVDRAIECLNYWTDNGEYYSAEEDELMKILKGRNI